MARRLLFTVLVLLTLVNLGLLAFVWIPEWDTGNAFDMVLFDLGTIVMGYAAGYWLVLPAALGLLMVVVAVRRGWVRSAWFAGLPAVALLVAAVLPMAAITAVAKDRGMSLDYGTPFASGAVPAPQRTETYASVDGGELKLDVWGATEGANRPAVLFVHGGGWIAGSRGMAPRWMQLLVDRGYAVFDIDYRLEGPQRWQKQTGDVKCAIGWVRANAAKLGVDPARIGLLGASAGANLSMLSAYTQGEARLPASCAEGAGDTSVRTVVSLYGVTDLVAGYPTLNSSAEYMAEKFTDGTPATHPEIYRLGSPITHVRPGLPPTLLVHGEHDRLIPASQSTTMAAKLAEAGVQHDVLMLPWTDHGFDVLAWGGWGSQIANPVVVDFFDKHLR
ncbi:acetyl esterase/lipase [Crossiella equi]|uniref:Acetyl esterase/lipase n=1 Tax=Crossiella equi TaxID=130796 RepID=A0ABS5ALE6_9PSEU|nr:alpha/beta hydrolase [Crossiella equi]MBP2477383.1 acetyl esterase/lipase [Crossiella equi]